MDAKIDSFTPQINEQWFNCIRILHIAHLTEHTRFDRTVGEISGTANTIYHQAANEIRRDFISAVKTNVEFNLWSLNNLNISYFVILMPKNEFTRNKNLPPFRPIPHWFNAYKKTLRFVQLSIIQSNTIFFAHIDWDGFRGVKKDVANRNDIHLSRKVSSKHHFHLAILHVHLHSFVSKSEKNGKLST